MLLFKKIKWENILVIELNFQYCLMKQNDIFQIMN